ncbi:substrate-binding periplasmic protein [Litoribrevibacter euphylliae]|uniref:Substrate-binding periplasmic protein n=1 Tax=Litoribrevibacter euphylliae TaxID=1834034 RepID=A0ABV7HLN8_9GAMM
MHLRFARLKNPFCQLVLILAGVSMLCSPGYADPKKSDHVHLGTGDWPPLISPEEDGFGPISQIVVESFEHEGITPILRFWPWSRTMENLNEGNIDASYAWRKTDERLETYAFSDPVYDTGNVFFYRKGYPFDWTVIEDLKAYRIGGVLDYAYSNEFVEAEKAGVLKLDRVADEKQLIYLLLAGRIDAFPASKVVGTELLRQLAPDQFDEVVIHPKRVSSHPLFLITPKNEQGQKLIERFNRGLSAIRESGRYDAINNRFQ